MKPNGILDRYTDHDFADALLDYIDRHRPNIFGHRDSKLRKKIKADASNFSGKQVFTSWLNKYGRDEIYFTADCLQQELGSRISIAINGEIEKYGISVNIWWTDNVPNMPERAAGAYCITVMKRLTTWEKLKRRMSNLVWRHTGRKARPVVCVE